ncbi:MAG: hypothetical protein ACK51F_10630 [Rhodospirillales bacterium]|jgi:hypothetical protein
MPTRAASIDVLVRDDELGTTGGTPFGVLNVETAQGTTDDDGVTVIVGNGYLQSIGFAAPADIKVTVHQPPVEIQPAALVNRVDDAIENTSTLTFNLAP